METTLSLFNQTRHTALLPALAFIITTATLVYLKKRQNYWSRFNVKGELSWPIIGDLYNIFFKDRFGIEIERRDKYGKIYGAQMNAKTRLFIADAEVIRQIAIKDFDVFPNHEGSIFSNKYQKAFLVWLKDDHWRRVRSMMTPTFTSGKIRKMFRFLDGCSEDLVASFKEKLQNSDSKKGAVLDLKESFGMYTMDGISTCCYGLKLQRESVVGDQKGATRDDLVRTIKGLVGFSIGKIAIILIFPKRLLSLIGFEMTSESKFLPLIKRVEKLIEIRRSSTKKYDDLLQLLIDARLGDKVELDETDNFENHHAGLSQEYLANEQEKLLKSIAGSDDKQLSSTNKQLNLELSDLELLSEAAFMLVAGYETTRTLLTNCAYVLAHRQEIQERLFEELAKIAHFDEEKEKYEFDYDELAACAYLDAFVSETLRYLPPAMHTDRKTDRDYFIEKYKIPVPKDMSVLLCIYAVHHDPDYWSQPEIFDPERFLPGNKEKVVPGSYIPFSIGPRHCIGMRFSLTEAKLGLAKVVMNFTFKPAAGSAWPPKPKPAVGLLEIRGASALIEARR